jgi:hypothetical protein
VVFTLSAGENMIELIKKNVVGHQIGGQVHYLRPKKKNVGLCSHGK